MIRRLFIFILCGILVGLIYIFFVRPQGELTIGASRNAMGTVVDVTVVHSSGQNLSAVNAAIDSAYLEIARIEDKFSIFKADNIVSQVNGLGRERPIRLDAESFDLIARAIEYSSRSRGAFDITIKPLSDVWKGALSLRSLPSQDELDKVMGGIGSDKVVLDRQNSSVSFSSDGMSIDLGGMAKGYAADRAIDILQQGGIKNAIISIGGDLYRAGGRGSGEPWSVAIRHPRDPSKTFATLKVRDKAVATSGDYERYTIFGGKRYSHIVDPHTGYPVGDAVVSATVIADNATDAEMAATALIVLGAEGVSAEAAAKGMDVILIVKDGEALRAITSPGCAERYAITWKQE